MASRRNIIHDSKIPKYASFISTEDPQIFHVACDGGTRLKSIDPFGYHMVGCKIVLTLLVVVVVVL